MRTDGQTRGGRGVVSRTAATVLALCLVALAPTGLAAPPEKLWTEQSHAEPLDPDAPVRMSAFSRLAEDLSPAVLYINVVKASGASHHPFGPMFGRGGGRPVAGLGSGFVIHEDGLALTNHHVIDSARQIEVKLQDGSTYDAEVVGSYPQLDVALLRFDPKDKLHVAPLGDSAGLQIGEWIVAIGNPFGLSHSVTAGIVSALGRREVQPGRRPMYANFIQTDASINPGNSGGPLINIRGEVVGINTAINAAGQGIGFAVPINMVKTILPQLAEGEVHRSYLGVKIGPVNEALAKQVGLDHPMGAVVHEVVQGFAADRAGLRPGDVITHWDEEPLEHWEDLSWVASTWGTDDPVDIEVRRGHDTKNMTLRLSEFPGEQSASSKARRAPRQHRAPDDDSAVLGEIGIQVSEIPTRMRRQLRMEQGHGVLIRDVDRGSPAAMAGMKPGDVLLQVNYEDVTGGVADFEAKVEAVASGEVLSFLVRRGDRQIFMAFDR
ncbi:MAG: trypsin-like peptidase domain-containing protein [Myxococcota bacterium]